MIKEKKARPLKQEMRGDKNEEETNRTKEDIEIA